MREEVPARRSHVPALDGLRGVAILLVLFFHFTMFGQLAVIAKRVPGAESGIARAIARLALSGWIGVDLFFVLSGYLITTILLVDKGRPAFLKRFYLGRAARILPLYYGFLAGYALVLLASGAHEKLGTLGWPALFGTNIALGLFGDGAIPHEIQHLWSLAIEEQFYLVFPLLVLLVSRPVLRSVCALGVAFALVFRLVFRPELPLTAFLTPARFDGLLAGALVATVLRLPGEGDASERRRSGRWLLATTAVLAAFVAWRGSLRGQDIVVDIFGRTPLNLFFGAVVAAAVTGTSPALTRALSTAPLRFFGRYSYAMYLLHIPLLAGLFALHIDIGHMTMATGGSVLVGYGVFVTTATALTVLAAIASYHLLEKRFIALRARLR